MIAQRKRQRPRRVGFNLSLAERMHLLCIFTDLVLGNNPLIVERKDAEPVAGRVRVLSKAQS
jgi:hypothetical protein